MFQQFITQFIPMYSPFLGAGLVAGVMGLLVWKSSGALREVVQLHHLQKDTDQAGHLWDPMLARLGPRTELETRLLRQHLQQAGLRGEHAIYRFGMVRLLSLASALGLIGLVGMMHLRTFYFVGCSGLFLWLGHHVPYVGMKLRIKARQQRMARVLPSVIDLMVLCLDVGLSVESAFERVTLEMQGMEPMMAEEASVMTGEMKAGLTFPHALGRMADRIGLEELVTLARLITQAHTLGASIAYALREYSAASFSKRMLGLEERAGKISAWMILPVTLCMLPAALIALGGPAVILVLASLRTF